MPDLVGFRESRVMTSYLLTLSSCLALGLAAPAFAQTVSDQPSPPDAPPLAQPSTTDKLSDETAAPAPGKFKRYDDLSMKGWDTPFPKTQDTILGDKFGIRDAMADAGFSMILGVTSNFQYDLLQNDGRYHGPQLYNGQRFTRTNTHFTLLGAWDLGQIGVDNGQIGFTMGNRSTSFQKVNGPNRWRVGRINYYQQLFGGKLEIKLGINDNSQEFFGTTVGGDFATGSLGPLASIPYQVGVSYDSFSSPTLVVRINFEDHFYEKAAVQRSLPPGGAAAEIAVNPSGFTFAPHGTGVLGIEEFGYNRPSAPGVKSMWFRAGGIFNTTRFNRYDGSGTTNNWALFAAIDRQFTQPDQSKPFRGVYGGLTYNRAPSAQNLVTDYYEGRIYGIGLLPGRPFDLASLVATYTGYGSVARAALTKPGERNFAQTETIIGSYGYRLGAGLYLQPGLGVTIHPLFSPRFGTALNAYLGVTALF